MIADRTSSQLWHRVMLVAFLLALAVRALVPSGWMAVADGGGLRIAVCSESEAGASSAAQQLFEKALPGHKSEKSDGGDGHCAFAGSGAALAAYTPLAEPLKPLTPAIQPRTPVAVAPGLGLAAPPPPKTGPPLPA